MVEEDTTFSEHFDKMTKTQLVKEAVRRKLKKSGSKSTLINRLKEYEQIEQSNERIEYPTNNNRLTDNDLEMIPEEELSVIENVTEEKGNEIQPEFYAEYIEFKQMVLTELCSLKSKRRSEEEAHSSLIKNLQDHVNFLQNECSEKNKTIETLSPQK